ncbi:MAG: hypothetical protein SFY67_05550 [Candidatus Melainabacteria bacterium]|nr:hypothetical protein [Candidatus Melainabacteria bacterium]
MKRNFLLSVILILTFMSALGGSIFNAAHAFVGSAHSIVVEDTAIDNAEDISLEDVVPLDPFLGSISFSKHELVQTLVFVNINCGLLALIQNAGKELHLNSFFEESSCSQKWLGKGLWLKLNNLRI